MKILYNPPTYNGKPGKDVKGFILKDYGLVAPQAAGSLGQYEHDWVADALVENFPFLSEVSPEEAKRLKESTPKSIQCDFPGCNFSTEAPIALSGHKRSHSKPSSELAVDESIAPIIGVKPIKPGISEVESRNNQSREWDGTIANGKDSDGAEWYGEGLTEDRSMAAPNIGDVGVFGG